MLGTSKTIVRKIHSHNLLDKRNDDNQALVLSRRKSARGKTPLHRSVLAQHSEHAGYQQDNEHNDNTYSVYKHNRPLMVTMAKQLNNSINVCTSIPALTVRAS